MKITKHLAWLLAIILLSCSSPESSDLDSCDCDMNESITGAMLASRFSNLSDLESQLTIKYFGDTNSSDTSNSIYTKVELTHCSAGNQLISILESGLSQDDIMAARDGDYSDQIGLILTAPFAIANRMELNKVYTLARWRPDLFGEGDVAFFNLAEMAVNSINTEKIAYLNQRDSSEKGYINSFNHITAQAFITSCFTEEIADFIADVHELHNMPELTSGKFTKKQLADSNNNPMDNYVDMINNEWGQELGKKLKKQFKISQSTNWTPELLADYLNEIQKYYCASFKIGMEPVSLANDKLVRFANKLNVVMKGVPFEEF
jgi:hypothetical protein